MNKTLYISDLDGTLLQPDATLSAFSTQALQRLTREGLCFSIATARTWESVRRGEILQPLLPLSAPVVLMNGALVYDTRTERFLKKELIPPDTLRELLRRVKAHGQTGFLYSHPGDAIRAYHEALARPAMQAFYTLRKETYGKRFVRTDDLAAHAEEGIIYFTTQDRYENLSALYADLQGLDEIDCVLYPDSYLAGSWFLECFSRRASKKNAVDFLRQAYHFDRVVGFGDNLNDLSLFAACDEGYAVANARDELKALAAGVIGSNEDDGVVRFLLNEK